MNCIEEQRKNRERGRRRDTRRVNCWTSLKRVSYWTMSSYSRLWRVMAMCWLIKCSKKWVLGTMWLMQSMRYFFKKRWKIWLLTRRWSMEKMMVFFRKRLKICWMWLRKEMRVS